MRLGHLSKNERIGKNYPERKPKFSSRGMQVGQVSPNVINSIYTPLIVELATKSLENYAGELADYDEALQEYVSHSREGASTVEGDVGPDGTIGTTSATTAPTAPSGANASNPPETPPPPPTPPRKPYFYCQARVDEFKEVLDETSKDFSTLKRWKVWAKANKFERRLDERYGIFRPLVENHPQIAHFVRSMQRKYAMGYFSPFRQKQFPISKSTSVILLFMMQRGGVNWKILVLSTLFLLIGLQPWALVLLIVVFNQIVERRKNRPLGRKMKSYFEATKPYYRQSQNDETETEMENEHKDTFLMKTVGDKLGDSEEIDMSLYDTLILGSGPGTLYVAALLSRVGRKVLVLSVGDDASGCLAVDPAKCHDTRFHRVPFDVESSNVPRISRQQKILAPALMSSTDYQGGVRFARIGREADGFAFEILSIPGVGNLTGGGDCIPFVLRAEGGAAGLMDDTARFLGDGWPDMDGNVGNSLTGSFIMACEAINVTAGDYFMSTRVLNDALLDYKGETLYGQSAIRYGSHFLDKCFPLNPHARSLMAGIGMKGENLKPSKTSMGAIVTNVCASTTAEGMHYPIGGPRALCHALGTVVEQSGGRIVTNVKIKELVFDLSKKNGGDKEKKKKKEKTEEAATGSAGKSNDPKDNPRCTGVQLEDGRLIQFKASQKNDADEADDDNVVISMLGFVETFIHRLSPAIRDEYAMPMGLRALAEQRPVFKVLFAIRGSADELDLTGADYYRLPAAALPLDEINQETGTITFGEIGAGSDTNDFSTKDEDTGEVSLDSINAASGESSPDGTSSATTSSKSATTRLRRSKFESRRNKFDSRVSWIKISFPSAKDPSFQARHGDITTCVVTIEADDDFVRLFDTQPKMYSILKSPSKLNASAEAQRLVERVKNDLLELYPQLQDDGNTNKIVHTELRGPFRRGLSHTPERYAAKGVQASTPFPGLYMGGSDLTVGESFSGATVSGYLVANAVVGYSALDMMLLEKTIVSDICQFTEPPDEVEEEDIAVPYKPPPPPQEAAGTTMDEMSRTQQAEDVADEGNTTTMIPPDLEAKKEQ